VATRLSRSEQQELTRQRLLDAALGVFRQRGFARATIDEIAELAGYTRGAFYSHFGSKEAAFVELLEVHSPARFEAFRASIAQARSDDDILHAIVVASVPPVADARGRLVDTVELTAHLVDNPELRQRALVLQEASEELLGWCAAEICRRRGRRLTCPEQYVGMGMLAFLTGLAQRLLLEPGLALETHAVAGLRGLIESASAEA